MQTAACGRYEKQRRTNGSLPEAIGNCRHASSDRKLAVSLKQKPIAEIEDETLVLADIAEKALAQLEQTVAQLLAITADEARNLGLPVNTEIPPEVLDLLSLYPQPIRGVPSVEYLPGPHSRSVK